MARFPLLLLIIALAWLPQMAFADLRYEVTFEALADKTLNDGLRDVSRLVSLADRPPNSRIGLERRAVQDSDRFRDFLRSRGYYDPTIDIAFDDRTEPLRVTVTIDPGPGYGLAAYQVTPSSLQVAPKDPGLDLGRRAEAADIVAAQGRLLATLAGQGFPLARVIDRQVIVDHDKRSLSVALQVDSGGKARFGPLSIAGLKDVSEDYVRRAIYWPEGEVWDPTRLEEVRRTLVRSELFASVRIDRATILDADNGLAVTLVLTERDKRSVGFGIGWSSDLGTEAEVFWVHRNLGGGGERLRFEGAYSPVRRIARTLYRDPDLIARGVDYLAGLEIEEAETKAYDIRAARVTTGTEIRLGEGWNADAGIAYERLIEDIDDGSRRFNLVSLPVGTTYDTTDDLLDPSRGIRTNFTFSPFLSPLGSDLTFYRAFFSQTGYLQLSQEPRAILAGWAHLGSILGASADDVPANKRFYAGGGGSIRAFGFQRAGPIDAAGDPVGGRALLAFGIEPRIRVTEDIGLVTFLEAANVYNNSYPDQSKMRTGAGFGVRYFTGIGPFRADIAFPLDRRPNVDDAFQIYLSFGQAF
jgi:translocation and assembly module TamA